MKEPFWRDFKDLGIKSNSTCF